jgi:hypothetical protein
MNRRPTADDRPRPSFVGPHEGRELELMLAGVKPMSLFAEPAHVDAPSFPETEFDELVAAARLIKRVDIERRSGARGTATRVVLYAVPDEQWRIDAMLMVRRLYRTLRPGWRPDLERMIGLLLGYERGDIESFLSFVAQQDGPNS